MQSLCGITHYDFNATGAYGYEQAFEAVYANNPQGVWTCRHQMAIDGKREGRWPVSATR